MTNQGLSDNTITLSDKLNDTERLSTLSHELGHAMAFAADAQREQTLPSEVRELEADGVSIMLQTEFGFPLTQSRISHFVQEYRACMQRSDFSFEDFLKGVDEIYIQTYQELQPYIENALQIFEKEKKDHQEDQAVAAEVMETEKAESPVPAETLAAAAGVATEAEIVEAVHEQQPAIRKDTAATKMPSRSFSDDVDAVLQDTMNRNDALYVSDTPKVLTDLGLHPLPMLMTQKHLKDIVHPKDPANTRYHGLPVEQVKQLPQMLESPAMVARSLTYDDDLVVITAQADPDNLPIMVAIHPNGQGIYELSQIDSNFITSVYGRTNFLSIDENGDLSQGCFLGRVMQAGGLLYQNKEKSRQLARDAQLQLPRGLTSTGSSSHEEKTPDGSIIKDSITQNPENVKPSDRKEKSPSVPAMDTNTPAPPKQRLFVDMDGTLTKFIDQAETPDALLQPGYFETLPPQQNVVDMVKQAMQKDDLDVYVFSAALNIPTAIPEKNAWLDQHLPEIDQDHRVFVENGCRKSLSVPGGLRKTDILLDDYSRNLHDWAEAGAIGVKLLNDINNTHGTWTNSENLLERTAVNYTDAPEAMLKNLASKSKRYWILKLDIESGYLPPYIPQRGKQACEKLLHFSLTIVIQNRIIEAKR